MRRVEALDIVRRVGMNNSELQNILETEVSASFNTDKVPSFSEKMR